jgi:hypothetical protein
MIPKGMVCAGCGTNEFLLSRAEAMKIITGWREDKAALGQEGWDNIFNFCTDCGGWGDLRTWVTMSVRFGDSDYIDEQISLGYKVIGSRMTRSHSQKIAKEAKASHRASWFKNGGVGAYLLDLFAKGEITWEEYMRREKQDYIVAKIPIQREHMKQELNDLRLQWNEIASMGESQ